MADVQPAPYVAYYETRPLRIGGYSTGQARAGLARLLHKHDLDLFIRTVDGREEQIKPSSQRLDPAATMMAIAVLSSAERGAEVDSVASGTAADQLLATFWWNEGRLVIGQRHHTGVLLSDGPSEAALREAYGIGALVDGDRSWDAAGRGLVDAAFRRMTEDERAAVRYIAIHRARESVGEDAAARYYGDNEPRIELYDSAVAPTSMFVGELSDPSVRPLKVLLHELGHALMYGPERICRLLRGEISASLAMDQAVLQAQPGRAGELTPRIAARRESLDSLTSWLGSSPVFDAYQIAVGSEPAPTVYGRTRGIEGFAEAFALWHLDRPALVRTSPKAAAFFDANAHMTALRAGVAAVEALAAPGL